MKFALFSWLWKTDECSRDELIAEAHAVKNKFLDMAKTDPEAAAQFLGKQKFSVGHYAMVRILAEAINRTNDIQG